MLVSKNLFNSRVLLFDGLAKPKGILTLQHLLPFFFSRPNSPFQTLQPNKAEAVEQYPGLQFNGEENESIQKAIYHDEFVFISHFLTDFN